MKRWVWLLLFLPYMATADSTLVLEEIPHPGPQTGERFDNNFKAIKQWTNLIDTDGDNVADKAGELNLFPTPCPDGLYAAGINPDGSAICPEFTPTVPTDWDLFASLPTSATQALNDLAQDKVAIADTGTITEEQPGMPDPAGLLDCQGPQCVHLGVTSPCLWYSTILGSAGWQRVCAITIGAHPAATCFPGMIFVDTDESDDANCPTTANNSLCLCVATDTWVALENN